MLPIPAACSRSTSASPLRQQGSLSRSRPSSGGGPPRCAARGEARPGPTLTLADQKLELASTEPMRRSRVDAVELLRRLVPRARPLDDRQQLGSMRISLRLRRLLLEQPNDARTLGHCLLLHRSLPCLQTRPPQTAPALIVARKPAIRYGPLDPFGRSVRPTERNRSDYLRSRRPPLPGGDATASGRSAFIYSAGPACNGLRRRRAQLGMRARRRPGHLSPLGRARGRAISAPASSRSAAKEGRGRATSAAGQHGP